MPYYVTYIYCGAVHADVKCTHRSTDCIRLCVFAPMSVILALPTQEQNEYCIHCCLSVRVRKRARVSFLYCGSACQSLCGNVTTSSRSSGSLPLAPSMWSWEHTAGQAAHSSHPTAWQSQTPEHDIAWLRTRIQMHSSEQTNLENLKYKPERQINWFQTSLGNLKCSTNLSDKYTKAQGTVPFYS